MISTGEEGGGNTTQEGRANGTVHSTKQMNGDNLNEGV